jgi:VWFA-related protein
VTRALPARRALRLLLPAAVTLLAAGAALPGQDPAQGQRTFRAGIDLVTVDVTVLDRNGVPVRGLDLDDFAVQLDGEARAVRVMDYVEFERIDAPIEIAPNRETGPPANATQEPRVAVLVLDDLSFEPQDAKGILLSATRFLASLRPNDLVGFATTTGEAPPINPSRDHEPVRLALERTVGRVGDRDPEAACPEVLEEGRCSCLASMYDLVARGQLENFESIALSLGAAPVGRTLVILTRGVAPTLVCGVPGTGNEGGALLERDLKDIQPFAQAVARAGVAAYILAPEPDGMTPALSDKWFSGAMLAADVAGARFERVIGQADRSFTRIRTAMSAYYRLGVEVPADRADSRVTVSVEVARDGVTVAARRSAMVPDEARAEMTIDEALRLAATRGEYWRDVPVTVAVAARQEAGVDGLQLGVHLTVPRDVPGPVQVVMAVVDEAGAVVWTGQGDMDVPAGSDEDYTRSTTVAVPEGTYRVRAAVADAAERLGMAERTVAARLHAFGAVRVSDIFSSWAGATDTYRFTLDRLPAEAELLHAEIEVYPADPATLAPLVVTWTLAPADGGEPFVERESDVEAEDGVLKAITELPIFDLEPGLYTLRATLSSAGTPLGTITSAFARTVR